MISGGTEVKFIHLTIFRIDFFGAAHGWGEAFHTSVTHILTMMKLDRGIPYLKKIQKIYKSRDASLEQKWLPQVFLK